MRQATILMILLGIAVAGVAAVFVFPRPVEAPLPHQASPAFREAIVHFGNLEVPVEVADSPEARSRGLSGRPALAEDRGMLFVFEEPGIYRFWMPDMNFPLDFIWIGSDGRVVGITESVPPLADISNPVWYTPPSPAQYVLEVNAGFAERYGIKAGDAVTLP